MTVRMNKKEEDLVKSFSNIYGMTISEFVRQTLMERIEDELDIRDCDEILNANKGERLYTHAELLKELGL